MAPCQTNGLPIRVWGRNDHENTLLWAPVKLKRSRVVVISYDRSSQFHMVYPEPAVGLFSYNLFGAQSFDDSDNATIVLHGTGSMRRVLVSVEDFDEV